jgi:hypothetical protein
MRHGTTLTLLAVALLCAGCGKDGPDSPYGDDSFDRVTVTVNGAGRGSGLVSASERTVGVDCRVTAGATAPTTTGLCSSTFVDAGGGGVITLTATPAAGSAFDAWTGCSSASGPVCMLTFSQGVRIVTFSVTVAFRTAP